MPTISVTPGDIGQKTDRNNLLTYSITGEMSTITEKINGTVVNTRNTTSGQAITVGLTQAQWDAIRFGRYADATGGKNTLTVEMGSEKWTYTFDKRLATDADILSATKAVKDTNEVYLPSVKKQLADAINAKGGFSSATDKLEIMASAISNIEVTKSKEGIAISPSVTKTFTTNSNGTIALSYISIEKSLLGFIPSIILYNKTDKSSTAQYVWHLNPYYDTNSTTFANTFFFDSTNTRFLKTLEDSSFIYLPVGSASNSYDWQAIE